MLLSKYPLLLFSTIHKIDKFLSSGVSTYPIQWNIHQYGGISYPMEYSPIQWDIHHNLPLLFIRSYPEDKLALGTLGVDDIVVHLLGLQNIQVRKKLNLLNYSMMCS